MNRYIVVTIIAITTLLYVQCGTQRAKTKGRVVLNIKEGELFHVKDSINLGGETLQLPKGVCLIPDGGVICNGIVQGNETRIKGVKPLFSHIGVKGTWFVPTICTSLFYDLNYENSLRDVFSLTSPDVKNKVIIEPGKYNVSIPSSGGAAISLTSNTTVKLDGDILLKPNDFQICYIFLINESENVRITGKGSITGDKINHKGTTGEWGMGIHIVNSNKVEVNGISVRDCWGDCIYIGKESSDIMIQSCTLNNGRRQGISITSAKKVIIKNCVITNVSGTAPEYGIDIEPNKFQTVEDVTISGIFLENCSGGITLYGNASGSKIKNINIENCTIVGKMKQVPISFSAAECINLNGCEVKTDGSNALYMQEVENISLTNNKLSAADEAIRVKGDISYNERGNTFYRNSQ